MAYSFSREPTVAHAVSPELNKWDFDGDCAPHHPGNNTWTTFSLGIFQWVAKAGARGKAGELKRGPIKQRIVGQTADPMPAYEKARKATAELNNTPTTNQ
jgi:hypothetical protein